MGTTITHRKLEWQTKNTISDGEILQETSCCHQASQTNNLSRNNNVVLLGPSLLYTRGDYEARGHMLYIVHLEEDELTKAGGTDYEEGST